ncbi:MAG: hypothetical protein ACTSUE_17285 [Promethearchaeota archaeon]
MRSLIIYPDDFKELGRVAQELDTAMKKFLKVKNGLMLLKDLVDPASIIDHDIIIFATPCKKNDIYWPLQVKVDGIIHVILKEDFSKKMISAFTFTKNEEEASRCLDAVLWTFHETTANVAKGLIMLDSYSPEKTSEVMKSYMESLKLMKKSIK